MKPIFFDKGMSQQDYLYEVLLSSADNQLITYLCKKYGISAIIFNDAELRSDWIETGWKQFLKANSNYLSPSLIAAIGWYSAESEPNHDFFGVELLAELFAKKQYKLALYLMLDKFKFKDDFETIAEKLAYCIDNYGYNHDLMPLIHALYLHSYTTNFVEAYLKTIIRTLTLKKLNDLSNPVETSALGQYFKKLYEQLSKNFMDYRQTLDFFTNDHMEYYSKIAAEELTAERVRKFLTPLSDKFLDAEQNTFKELELDIIDKSLNDENQVTQKIKMIIVEMEKYPQEKPLNSKLWLPWDMAYSLFSHLCSSLMYLNLKELPERIYADIVQAKNCLLHSPVLAFSLAAPLIFFNPFLGTVIASESLLFAVDAYRGNPRFHFGVNQAIEDTGHAYAYLKDKLCSGASLSIS